MLPGLFLCSKWGHGGNGVTEGKARLTNRGLTPAGAAPAEPGISQPRAPWEGQLVPEAGPGDALAGPSPPPSPPRPGLQDSEAQRSRLSQPGGLTGSRLPRRSPGGAGGGSVAGRARIFTRADQGPVANCSLTSDLSFVFEKTFSLLPSTREFRGDTVRRPHLVSRLWLPDAQAVSLRVGARSQEGRQEVRAQLGPGEREPARPPPSGTTRECSSREALPGLADPGGGCRVPWAGAADPLLRRPGSASGKPADPSSLQCIQHQAREWGARILEGIVNIFIKNV